MRKIVLCATTLLLCSIGFGQTKDSTTKFVFGFNLGLNYSNTQVKSSDPSVNYTNGAGFRIGVLLDWKLSKHLSFSPKIELAFHSTKITVAKKTIGEEVYEIYPVVLDFAPHITYKLMDKKNAPYLLLGPSFKIPLNGSNGVKYATHRSSLALDFGFGLDKKLTYFNFAPELRYSIGLMNLSGINVVKQLYFHNVTLVMNFKG